MPDTWITDLRHFLDSDGHVPPDIFQRSLVRQLCGLVEAVTNSPSERLVQRDIACRRRPGRQRCPGLIGAGFEPGQSIIRWACPACGDNGWIHGWHRTRWDKGGRGSLPAIRRLTIRRGLIARLSEASILPAVEIFGEDVPRQVVVAIHDNALIGASGEYGDPRAGDPLQYDELRIDHATGTDRIVVYNLAIMILGTAEEIYPRVLRVLSTIDTAGVVHSPCH